MASGRLPVSRPVSGWETMLKMSSAPSRSVPSRLMRLGVPAGRVSVCARATGASLMSTTLRDTVAGAEVVVASEAVKVKLSGPM